MNFQVNEQGFVYDAETPPVWLPPLNLKQFEVFNCFSRYLLVDGPRKSSKTWGLCHKVLRHCFDTNGGKFSILNKTMKLAKSSGVWNLIIDRMIPMWVAGCPGFEITEGPKVSGDTKLSFIKFRNRYGTTSELQCHSLEHAAEVEAKFKSSVYSGFWCSEADQYMTEHAFHILCDSLRMTPFIPYDQHQIIMDMNPPDSGENNWFYDMFFKLPLQKVEEGEDETFKKGIRRIGFSIDDNVQLDISEKNELISRYRKRPSLYARFIEGRWVQDITDGHFSESWDESVHVIGRTSPNPAEEEVIVPSASSRVLLTGWDMGDNNHSFHILDKITTDVEVEDPKTKQTSIVQLISFNVIDEMVVIASKYVTIRDFVDGAVEKMDHWEAWMKKTHNLTIGWRHWSDTSAFNWTAAAEKSEAAIAYEVSKKRVVLEGAPKYRNSKKDRVQLIAHLLDQNRLFVSAQLSDTRKMFANLRKGKTAAEYIRADEHRHPFDSLSYPIIAEAPIDMLQGTETSTAKKAPSPHLVVASM
jgi:hypothetical protein